MTETESGGVMSEVAVMHGLVVTSSMFYAAEEGIGRFAPGSELTWEAFIHCSNWRVLINRRGGVYAMEMALPGYGANTPRLIVWNGPEQSGQEKLRPHRHACYSSRHVLLGGYTERRYRLTGTGRVEASTVSYREGSLASMWTDVFHVVTDVSDPGRTVTLSVDGVDEQEAGYLDPATGRFTET